MVAIKQLSKLKQVIEVIIFITSIDTEYSFKQAIFSEYVPCAGLNVVPMLLFLCLNFS
ncbi:hypothetical protein Cylst_0072 [Cylindrospermum stagnale PCC 7417]|uniref:Uncharacterized protein n=1 Tax=Cylindrospermum stagnale PCC 7417 TaxID=56107 RepID=K9WRP3_9NOST|nr:hypothetical protein Cylst_0072 [Cylindrospermum stagnale PCC 7417]